jgi:hypothetical protein
MKRLFVTTCSILALVVASMAFATGTTTHTHKLITKSGKTVQVGPDPCGAPDDSGLHRAFHNFHDNVHLGTPPDVRKLADCPAP